jgi:hypothetical protein
MILQKTIWRKELMDKVQREYYFRVEHNNLDKHYTSTKVEFEFEYEEDENKMAEETRQEIARRLNIDLDNIILISEKEFRENVLDKKDEYNAYKII